MLHKETLDAGTLALIKRLQTDPVLDGFVLVGGTALALMIGHRISVDIDEAAWPKMLLEKTLTPNALKKALIKSTNEYLKG